MIVATNAALSIFVWSLVLMALVVAGFLVVALVKRSLRQPDVPPSVGFSLGDLRRMHQEGQLTDEEFERARAKLVAGLRSGPQKPRQPG